ncbi:MAG: PSD1 and planctomycete cytochrome C domain-containing protein, partial [Planctomyces sp.]
MMNTQCGDFDGCGFPSGGRRVLCRLLLGLVSSLASVQAQETAAPSPASTGGVVAEVPPLVQPDAALSFERQVRPLLKTWCLDCHGGEATEGGLDLRQRRFLMRGGESGPAAVAGDAAGSLLLQLIRSGEMPPGEKKMAAADAAVLEQWIAAGAPTLRDEPAQLPPGLGITEEERSYWAFQPIRRPVVPEFDAALRIRTPIDALLMQQMQPRGLTFSPDADRRTLIRRASLDLLGIPPTPEQVDEFVNDPGEDAWERLVDRLLAMPQYGERWGRHWLDAAGYADSEGATNTDAERPNAWRYRDYVIQSFNSDKPASRFIQEQLAGDELAGSLGPELTAEQTELLTAVGFLTMAANGTGSGDNSAAARNQTITDTIRIVSTSLLGLSVGCAQCHDHRYDPISQVDYYRLRAVFDPALDWQNWKTPAERQVSLYTTADRQKATEVESRAAEVSRERGLKEAEYMRAALEQELTKYAEPLREQLMLGYETPCDKRTAEQQDLLKAHPAVNISPGVLYQYNQAAADDLKKYAERIAAIRAEKPVEHFLRTLVEPAGHLPASHRFHRGEFGQPKESVTPGELQAASLFTDAPEIPVDDPQLPTTGRRLAYAKWLTSGRHPLLARVLMNRFWLHHFGRAFVSTPGEFGRLGAAPSQPELLDWLAAEFMEGGWTWKRMHRLVLMSTVYRQSGGDRAELAAIDPNNLLYWRKPLIRLDAEVVRDAVLAVSGGLNSAMGGAPAAVQADDTGQIVEAGVTGRRSVYIQVRRSQPLAMLAAFDAPVMELNCTGRTTTNSAPQALLMM